MRIAVIGPCNPAEFLGEISNVPGEVPRGLVGTPINGLVRAFLDLGHSVHLISASPDLRTVWRADGPRLKMSVVPYRTRPRDRALDLFRLERNLMAQELESSDAEVVSAHWSYEFGWVGVSSGRPCVLSVHDAPLTILRSLPDPYRLLRTLMAYRVRFSAAHVTAVSPYLARNWRKQMLYRPPIEVIPNITPPLEQPTPIPHRRNVILDIGDASPRKNMKRLIEGFGVFSTKVPNFELRLVGGGLLPDGPLAQWARSEGLDKNVAFLGNQSRAEIAVHLGQASIFCHSAVEESQPMCLLEAMSAGVPVIGGAKSGGVPWTLDYGSAGLLVDVTDPNAIGEALYELHRDEALRRRLVLRGKTLVAERHSKQTVANAYLHEFHRAMS
ncbi:glycosyltransferase family 4 protein [Arthrobacter sp. SO3]|uniref:glycosyltransferase family 4 protein n=1 Tax=Arthrobacter sp. SO3 TaxID=1897057 RepID=UPI001D000DF9|nr:glycosyltransferase family 4 protein [Arthrobacter sp. SO3]MCB5291206.1 N-acetyl-alpha-D-glucosaminyl L-malate synthase [Arthrobacter sp. SO3]